MPLSTGSIQQQVDALIDACMQYVLVAPLLVTPDPIPALLMHNIETGRFEPYPEGWWMQVAQVRLSWGLTMNPDLAITTAVLDPQPSNSCGQATIRL
jgi:hypothetical protein